jgi:hypothetical protein
MSGVAAQATTATPTATPTPINGLEFTKNYLAQYKKEEGTTIVLPHAEFTFTMTPDTSVTVDKDGKATASTADGLPIYPGISLGDAGTVKVAFTDATESQTDVTLSTGSTVSGETKKGTFSFANVSWHVGEPAVYRYIVKETAGTDTNKTQYDATQYVVDVTVNNAGEVLYAYAWKSTVSSKTAETKEPIVFNNTSLSDQLKITKTVEGTLASKVEKFEFTINFPLNVTGNTGLTTNDKFLGVVTKADGSIDSSRAITITPGTAATFKLAHGESLTIEGIPHDVNYVITETSVDKYETTIKGVRKSTSENTSDRIETDVKGVTYDSAAQKTPIIDGGNIVEYTNTKEVTPTGIMLDVAPYLAIVAIAAGCAVVFLVSKRKRTVR